MKKFILISCLLSLVSLRAGAFTGFYQTIDDETNKPKSIVALYNYDDGKLGGRVVALYGDDGKVSETLKAPIKKADKIKGAPFMSGLDIIWNMKLDDGEYRGGKIMDPKSGKVYSSVMWKEKGELDKLRVRGKIGPFGRTQTWNVLKTTALPKDLQKLDMTKWTPKTDD